MSVPLRDRLLALRGVAEAIVDGAEDSPAGVRVTLAAEADAAEVGREVQRVLAAYGIRARIGAAGVLAEVEEIVDGPPPPPGAPGQVVTLPGVESWGPRRAAPMAHPVEPLAEVPERRLPPLVTGANLEGLSVEETREGVLVRATTEDGRSAVRRARWSEGGVNEAVLAAVSELTGSVGPPMLVDVAESTVDGSTVLTVVLELVDGTRVAGASVVEAGTAFAVAKAAWRALAH